MTIATERELAKDTWLIGDLVVFDGVCVLCSGFARWIVHNDGHARFRFVTAQSPLGQSLLSKHGLRTDDFDSNLVLIGGAPYLRLDSIIAIADALGWPWRGLRVLRLLPMGVRDWLYQRIARNRYALFGKKMNCEIPDARLRERLLD